MVTATFRFHGELSVFIAREHRNVVFDYDCARGATLKHAVEALGVPHTEIGRLLVDQEPATLARVVRPGNAVEVFPHDASQAPARGPLGFVADVHLGALARFLRMLGFDTRYENTIADRDIVDLASREHRIVLTCDRELLKCRDIARGCFVHATKPEAQLKEVAARYGLELHMQPFTLCLLCNLHLETIGREEVGRHVPERIAAHYAEFSRCPGCERIYWKGSHWTRMCEMLSMLHAGAADTSHRA